ncbi:putative glycerophosphoryl diester phosphodiesterase 1 [Nostocoides japonicum T1-X7]|uniref:Putative glycerophosphoryl diester phosphodiesterase 1 n=1 Tax=Nostocoides japonicum T1-X7 TaxID=1194083 RepID=A0A077LXH8_9MICO|nr:glycerophosphodiester phosphodiesterase family protein [Tetrasphaera japonica]CCH78608.1 putative glycerophosphoryl diester phosphodiesterase 1 [Tetrasphaera japonica T1-X7]
MSASVAGNAAVRPLVIAHRGASRDEPEHTLAAYSRAVADGADGLECDVRLTADGHLVCVHDRRVNRTSNGAGVVSTLELAQLEALDWGSWKALAPGDEPEAPYRDRNMLLTLNRFLTMVTEVDRPLVTLVETKHPSRHGGKVEKALSLALARFGLDGRDSLHSTKVMSFSHLALQRMRSLNPDVELVQLLEYFPVWMRDGSLPKGVTTIGITPGILRRAARAVRRQQANGHQVYVWTVDEADDVSRCLDAGVDAIITNRPRFVMDQIATSG